MGVPKTVCVALIQSSCGNDKASNIKATLEQIRSAANQGARIVCLQELFASRYPCQTEDHDQFKLAEPIPGPTTAVLSELALELEVVIVAGSVFERRAAGLYHNTSVVINADGKQLGCYRKMHIPDDPFYYEKFYFTPGDLGFPSFSTRYGPIGVCICWDQWFPEAARLTILAGAELLFFPTAIGWIPTEKRLYGESQIDAWVTMLRSHAIANGCFVMAPNRVGTERELEFWGNSVAIDPYGQVIVQGSTVDPEMLLFECDRGQVETARTHWPFLRDRRIDAYEGLSRRWNDE